MPRFAKMSRSSQCATLTRCRKILSSGIRCHQSRDCAMTSQLDGYYTKLARAKSHLAALKTATDELFGTRPERIPADFDAVTGKYVIRARRSLKVPLEWSTIVGDVVHNL